MYPWGKTWPPPANAGNYAGSEAKPGTPDNWPVLANFREAFPRTCVVPGHVPNALGVANETWKELTLWVAGAFAAIAVVGNGCVFFLGGRGA